MQRAYREDDRPSSRIRPPNGLKVYEVEVLIIFGKKEAQLSPAARAFNSAFTCDSRFPPPAISLAWPHCRVAEPAIDLHKHHFAKAAHRVCRAR
jgi:hypothetical protein